MPHIDDEEMEIEPMAGNSTILSNQPFSYSKIIKMLKSHKWS
jgi:hypothetical protein